MSPRDGVCGSFLKKYYGGGEMILCIAEAPFSQK
jgi:hypothetical protein